MDQALDDPEPAPPAEATPGWRAAFALFGRPQPVSFAMVAFFAIIPVYLFIGEVFRFTRSVYVPETALDRMLPLLPAWSLVYGSLLLVALLPVFVIHQQELVHRTVKAFLAIWLTAYVVFFFFPTVTSRPQGFAGEGFFAAALRLIYDSDTRYNCFPSLHVGQCFLAAFACSRVHRGVGWVAGVWAALVALSTLLTKQHYVVDVVGGVLLAYVAYVAILKPFPRDAVPAHERRLAPRLAAAAFSVYAGVLVILWIAYAVWAGAS